MLKPANIIFLFLLLSQTVFSKKLKEGIYRGVLYINPAQNLEVPFNFEVRYSGKKPTIIVKNADERIVIDEVVIKGDSVNFKMPVFDTEFRTVLKGRDLEGTWINHYKTENNRITFKAFFNDNRRFLFVPGKPNPIFEGRWETTFSPGRKDSSKAIGVFHHTEQTDYMTGTFLSETGDYRYLEGMKHGNGFSLSAFDGKHVYLFTAEITDNGGLSGKFFAGLDWIEEWRARRNENFNLADPESITFVKNAGDKVDFSFPDIFKNKISLSDEKFANKPVIIQVMGSWCPNCMDESVYLSSLYAKYKNEGLQIIALAFEKTTDFDKASALLLRMKTRLKMDYDILITQQSGSAKASETFPALNKITAFPTTIYLNKKHEVVKIYTGFSGPATGHDYQIFKERTEALVNTLLKD